MAENDSLPEETIDRLRRLRESATRFEKLLGLHAPERILRNELRLMQIHGLLALHENDAARVRDELGLSEAEDIKA